MADPTPDGATQGACAPTPRKGYGCEISPAYCDVILRRMQELTGEEPVLTTTGQIFQEVAEDRGVIDEKKAAS